MAGRDVKGLREGLMLSSKVTGLPSGKASHHKESCFTKSGYNTVSILLEPDPSLRLEIEEGLVDQLDLSCNDQTAVLRMFPKRLIEGYQTFRRERFDRERTRYEELGRDGQAPNVMVIGCCDSRVSPEVIFDASPGELFVIRNVANLVPPFETGTQYHGTSAAIEFAVQALKVKHIVVLGHANCGGVRVFADGLTSLSPNGFIGKWMTLMAPAAERVGPRGERDEGAYMMSLEMAAIDNSLANLTSFPAIRSLVAEGQLALHGAYFGIAKGFLSVRDGATGDYKLVNAPNDV